MKKLNLNLNLLLAAMLVFTVAAWAQGGGGGAGAAGGQGGSQTSPSVNSKAPGADVNATSSMPDSNRSTEHRSSIEGCIVQQGSDYYIQPTKGDKAMVRLSGEDVSAHVGHKVKVHGKQETAVNKGSDVGGSGTPAASATTAGSSEQSSANQLPQGANVSAGVFNVTKIDMISGTCNAKAPKTTPNPQYPPL